VLAGSVALVFGFSRAVGRSGAEAADNVLEVLELDFKGVPSLPFIGEKLLQLCQIL
jgi:hypothetical protein